MWSVRARFGGLRALLAPPASRNALRQYQARRLGALVRHAYARVPYYRRLFDRAGLSPASVETLDDLARIPMSDKIDFREVPEADLVARGVRPDSIVRFPTSGSTGVPMVTRSTRFETRLLQAFRMQVMMGLGLRPRDRRSIVLFDKGANQSEILERFGIFRNARVQGLAAREQIVADLRAQQPDVIRGYPSALASLADVMTEDDRTDIHPRFVTTDSEQLTAPMRRQIEQAFRAQVFDVYDCFECNVVASQCPTGGQYHVLDTAVIVEVLRDGRPAAAGEGGEVVLTALHSWASPLIRYRIGDLVDRGEDRCPCGAPNSCIGRVIGRLHDQFRLIDGRQIHPGLFATAIYPLVPWLRRYQIVQEASDRVVVNLQLVPGAPPVAALLETMTGVMSRALGEAMQLRVELVDDIPCEPNGKFRPFRCLVSNSTSP
jgi:phenylacetate-CoA ligase